MRFTDDQQAHIDQRIAQRLARERRVHDRDRQGLIEERDRLREALAALRAALEQHQHQDQQRLGARLRRLWNPHT